MLLKMWLSEKVEHLVTILSSFKKCMHCFCVRKKCTEYRYGKTCKIVFGVTKHLILGNFCMVLRTLGQILVFLGCDWQRAIELLDILSSSSWRSEI